MNALEDGASGSLDVLAWRAGAPRRRSSRRRRPMPARRSARPWWSARRGSSNRKRTRGQRHGGDRGRDREGRDVHHRPVPAARARGSRCSRRASSLVAHPTTQGVSLRGVGPSGVSRTLVLLDGLPLNDPFGRLGVLESRAAVHARAGGGGPRRRLQRLGQLGAGRRRPSLHPRPRAGHVPARASTTANATPMPPT